MTLRNLARSLACIAMACPTLAALAVSPPAAVQQKARAATFEVVVPKTVPDPLAYERPLPFDLEPFVIRTDAYWSIGSAFAIGKNTFATAGHVLVGIVGSRYGTPALRDSAGHVYPIDQILKFSADQDFAVFSVRTPPPATPLVLQAVHKLDAIVFAVGNALGQGVVLRDGLLTSETPEDQDGRWKWLRFSAAASPGNSGGPLLDTNGAVIGLITAKSPNENLNYALPIKAILDADAKAATFDTRQSFRLPVLLDSETLSIKKRFALPRDFDGFCADFQSVVDTAYAQRIAQSLSAHEGELFPRGDSAKALDSGYFNALPSVLFQTDDKSWKAFEPESLVKTDLTGDGHVTTAAVKDIQAFRLVRPDHLSTDDFYADPAQFAGLLLKGLKVARTVGGDTIRVTAMGSPTIDVTHTDRNGRVWQVRAWWLGYSNAYVLAFCLPTPEGYSGFAQIVPGLGLHRAIALLKVVTDYALAQYEGTAAQWHGYLSRTGLLPAFFGSFGLQLDPNADFRFESAQLTLDVPRSAVPVSDRSGLVLAHDFSRIAGNVAWGVVAISLLEDIDRTTAVQIVRWAKPPASLGQEAQQRWEQMSRRKSPYDNVAQRLPPPGGYTISTVVGAPWNGGIGLDPESSVLYHVRFDRETASLPRELEDRQRAVVNALHILER
jgi:hypothetical protein